MSIIVDKLPQTLEPIQIILLEDIIKVLPDTLDYPLNVWVGGKLARYGQTSENLLFLVEQDEEPHEDLRQYFEKISQPYIATVGNEWINEKLSALRLYNEGNLIIDKKTLTYSELPAPTKRPPILYLEDILKLFPKEIEWKETIYLTGGIVKSGWSGNDIDFMVDSTDKLLFSDLRKYFTSLFNCKIDVGNADMPEREPVYKFKLYEDGICQL